MIRSCHSISSGCHLPKRACRHLFSHRKMGSKDTCRHVAHRHGPCTYIYVWHSQASLYVARKLVHNNKWKIQIYFEGLSPRGTKYRHFGHVVGHLVKKCLSIQKSVHKWPFCRRRFLYKMCNAYWFVDVVTIATTKQRLYSFKQTHILYHDISFSCITSLHTCNVEMLRK